MQEYSTQVVILGAGRAARGIDNPAMRETGGGNRVLDWLLEAFATLPEARVSFVGGYNVESVREAYPQMEFAINPRWRGSGPSESLSYAHLDINLPLWVSYADVVYRPGVVEQVAAAAQQTGAHVVVAVDKQFRNRYERRSAADLRAAEKVICCTGPTPHMQLQAIGRDIDLAAADGEFCGLVRLSARALAEVLTLIAEHQLPVKATLPQLLKKLLDAGLAATAVDVDGEWAELNAPQDLARFVLGTKAESLERLAPLLVTGIVGDLLKISAGDWHHRSRQVLAEVKAAFPGVRIIVRSSSHQEDGWTHSAAGAFESVAGVDSRVDSSVAAAINKVFDSYGASAAEAAHAVTNGDEARMPHVLIQEMVADVRMAGVVMSRSPQTQAPYYVISFDSETTRTDTVTGGIGEIRTVFLQRDSAGGISRALAGSLAGELRAVINTTREIETLVGHDSIDIEFAVDGDGAVHVLQVRPLVIRPVALAPDDGEVAEALAEAQARIGHQSARAQPFVLGERTVWSVMSDWNPAEIIGPKPRRLAHSLYRHLITDEVWAAQRAANGYRDVRPCPLLVNILGHPYVDVRASFNSFVPASLDTGLATRLVDHYVSRLRQGPTRHDKIEFEIAYTCLAFDHEQRVTELTAAGFSREELVALKDGLRLVTRRSVRSCAEDLARLANGEDRISRILNSALEPLERCRALLQETRRFGTPLFANLARSGFVAASFLRSLVSAGVAEQAAVDGLLRGVRTVSTDLQRDAWRVSRGALSFDSLVRRYGHLRPGTYDLCSVSYAEAAEEYLRPMVDAARPIEEKSEFDSFAAAYGEEIQERLDSLGLELSTDDLLSFIRAAIEGREFGKFVFTRGLSAALDAIAEFAAGYGLSRRQVAHVALPDLLQLSGQAGSRIRMTLDRLVEAGQAEFALLQAVHLPGFIGDPRDLVFFEQEQATANFVTNKKIRGGLVELSSDTRITGETGLTGKVALITNADPGFDWLFGRQIAGLITMYGGANSHMAVRAAEFSLPAAIGVGVATYEQLRPEPGASRVVELDCGARRVRVVV